MPEPIKISEQNRALTCDEYDNNLDILRDRANHTGTQSCTTINDLDSCLATSSTVGTINNSIGQNTTRIINLENSLSASGSIANDLNSLEAQLTADINENRGSITALETNLDALEIRVSGAESNLVSLTNVVNLNNTTTTTSLNAVINVNNSQNTRLTNVENRATTLNADILTEAATRQSAVNNLQAEIDAEEINRINGDILLTTAIDNEEANRITAINTVTNTLNTEVQTLDNKIITEKNSRIAVDDNLQFQIDGLVSALTTAIPTGTILPYAGNFNTIPTGFLLCAGAPVSRTTFASLFSLIGTRYGIGNGTSTFNIPDFRDKTIYGSFAGTLTAANLNVGLNSVPLAVVNLPPHDHPLSIPAHVHDVNIQHDHHLYIHPHTHTTGFIGQHVHNLYPYRKVLLGGGGEDDVGGELTDVQSDSTNIYPNTDASNAAGPVVNPTTVGIFSPPWQGSNRTDMLPTAEAEITTDLNSPVTGATGTRGSGVGVDVRQASLAINFIIKT
jgi:microcystin-dependent protein